MKAATVRFQPNSPTARPLVSGPRGEEVVDRMDAREACSKVANPSGLWAQQGGIALLGQVW
jgi:hypothetical protein